MLPSNCSILRVSCWQTVKRTQNKREEEEEEEEEGKEACVAASEEKGKESGIAFI